VLPGSGALDAAKTIIPPIANTPRRICANRFPPPKQTIIRIVQPIMTQTMVMATRRIAAATEGTPFPKVSGPLTLSWRPVGDSLPAVRELTQKSDFNFTFREFYQSKTVF
jgi:hypothetical protein